MEAVPRLPMISFELKISPDRPPTDFVKLKQYIRDFYNEDPESYSTEIHNLESLRANAVRPARDANGCNILKKYFCQLHFLQSRFPMGKDGTAAVPFTWRDAYASMVCTMADIRFEMVAILHNIGALHSQLGAADNRTSAEGLKLACTHFQCAAWAFQHLKDSFPQPAGVDVSPDLMQFMQQICLAQAQECILEKSMTDNRKAAINAKVAAQIVDFYNMALNALIQTGGADDGCILETVGAKIFKSWKKYVKFKLTYYGCIALLYQGMQSEEQQKMGERVAYYQAAFDKLSEALRLSKGLDQPEAVSETLAFTMDVVEGKRKAAKNENEFIYHEKVPEKDELPDVKGAALVKGTAFSVNDLDISGPDIFSKLVPMKAHEASSMYSEEKAKLLRKVGGMVDEKDQEVVSFMSSLQLEHLNAIVEPDILPQELIDRCAALSAKPDAIQNLIDAMDRLTGLYHDVDGMLKEILELIKIEEASEKEYQEVMGPRPPSIVATDLTREANKYKEAHAKAAESNETLHKAMAQHIANLRVMSLPLSELHKQLPSVSVLNLEDNKTLKDLKLLVGKVEEMRRQRSMLSAQLRDSICSDDITAQLVTRSSENLQSVFNQELQKHSKYVSLIETNLSAQEKILSALTDAYADFTDTRKAISEIVRQRNLILTALMSSYDAYEDLIAKSNKGLEFYRKLETNVTKLLQRVKGTCKVQEEEREQILIKNGKQLPSKKSEIPKDIKSVPVAGSGLKLKDYLQNMKKDGTGVYSVSQNPATASVPYNPTQPNYGAVQPPAAHSSQPICYPDSLPTTDVTQTWVPSVRPAPVGSENNANKVTDLKTDAHQNFSYPSTATSYLQGYDPQYYYSTSSQTSAGDMYYNQGYANNSFIKTQPQGISGATVATSVNNSLPYQQPLQQMPSSNASSIVPSADYNMASYPANPSSYNTSYPGGTNYASISNVDANKCLNQYQQPQHRYSNNQANYPTADYFQKGNINGYQQGYLTANSNPPQVSASYSPLVQGYNSNSGSPNHAAVIDQTQPNKAFQEAVYSKPVSGTSSSSTAYATQAAPSSDTYTLSSSYVNHSGYAYQSQVSGSYQYGGEHYQQPTDVSYNWQQHQQQTQQPYQMPQMLQQQQQVTGHDQNWSQPSTYASSSSTPTVVNTNVSYTGGQSNIYASVPTSGGSAMPSSNATGVVAQHPGHNYYPPSYPQQYQYPAVPGMSHYTHAGQGITSQTNSSQTSVQGQTFAAQYNGTQQPTNSINSGYYSHQYGYQVAQYGNSVTNSGNNSQVVSPVDQGQVTPVSPMTYMQASNSGLKMTYSQHHVSGSASSDHPTSDAASSNVDLLAGLDVSINETPLLPLEPSNSKDKSLPSSVSVSNIISDKQPSVIKESDEVKVEEKLASLSIQSLPAPSQPEKSVEPPPFVPNINKEDRSKHLPKDPFLDPDVLSQFITEVEKFEKFVDGLTSKTLNGPTTLDIKWKELQDIQDKDSQKLISVARCYPMKNRFPDILPYDVSRVELPSTKDDYINASHVQNISTSCPNFIATQSPMPSTYADFWTMVLEYQVEIVVCLLNDMEINESIYWPAVKNQEEKVGRVTVNLQSTNIRKHWVERIILVSDGRLARNIIHLQFTEWPGSSFPASPGPFLSLASETLNLWSQQRGSGPIVVHCVAGVGRSGLFIASTASICEIQMGHGLPDLITLIASVSSCRKNALHDREHLKFAYQTLLYYAQDILMKRGILASRSSFEEKRPKSHTRHPSQDFLLGPPKEVSSGNVSESSTNVNNEGADLKNAGDDPFRQIDPMWPIKRFQ